MLTKLFHCSAVYSDARIKATEQWGGRDGESSEIGTRQDERVNSLTNELASSRSSFRMGEDKQICVLLSCTVLKEVTYLTSISSVFLSYLLAFVKRHSFVSPSLILQFQFKIYVLSNYP